MQIEKTNVMRLLDQAQIPYRAVQYEYDEADLSGVHAAETLGLPVEIAFKTLVARGSKGGFFVFVIPVAEELDLKKAARAAGEKKIEMLHVKELLGITGYIRGGCSPVGMKKVFPTFIDETAELFDEISVSAGMRGKMVLVDPQRLIAYVGAQTADLTV